MNSQPEPDILREYLGRLRAGLAFLPDNEREASFRELAQHVEALVEETISAGGDREQAIAEALQKFGDPERIAQKVVADYWRAISYPQALRLLVSFVKSATGGGLGAMLAAIMLTGAIQGAFFALADSPGTPIHVFVMLGAICGIPMGLALGRIWSTRHRFPAIAAKMSRRKRWLREHMALVVTVSAFVLVLAIVAVLESSLSAFYSRPLIMNLAMTLGYLIVGCASYQFYFRRLKVQSTER